MKVFEFEKTMKQTLAWTLLFQVCIFQKYFYDIENVYNYFGWIYIC